MGLREVVRGLLRRRGETAEVEEVGADTAMDTTQDGRWLVAGLGNPGPRYAGNRHNVGHMVADALASRQGERWKGHKAHVDVAETRISGISAVLAKPRSYMNLSGGPVAGVSGFFSVPIERVVVVHDDLDLPFGALKLKRGGGAGGHNGLRSVTKSLSSPDYIRVRFGVGRPPGRMEAADYVLRDFSTAERKELDVAVERAADAVETILTDGLEKAQNIYHAS